MLERLRHNPVIDGDCEKRKIDPACAREHRVNEALVARLKEVPGVNSVEEQVDRLAIRLHEDQTSIEDLHDHLVSAGARIRMFQPEAMDMETAFMKLTEGKTA